MLRHLIVSILAFCSFTNGRLWKTEVLPQTAMSKGIYKKTLEAACFRQACDFAVKDFTLKIKDDRARASWKCTKCQDAEGEAIEGREVFKKIIRKIHNARDNVVLVAYSHTFTPSLPSPQNSFNHQQVVHGTPPSHRSTNSLARAAQGMTNIVRSLNPGTWKNKRRKTIYFKYETMKTNFLKLYKKPDFLSRCEPSNSQRMKNMLIEFNSLAAQKTSQEDESESTEGDQPKVDEIEKYPYMLEVTMKSASEQADFRGEFVLWIDEMEVFNQEVFLKGKEHIKLYFEDEFEGNNESFLAMLQKARYQFNFFRKATDVSINSLFVGLTVQCVKNRKYFSAGIDLGITLRGEELSQSFGPYASHKLVQTDNEFHTADTLPLQYPAAPEADSVRAEVGEDTKASEKGSKKKLNILAPLRNYVMKKKQKKEGN